MKMKQFFHLTFIFLVLACLAHSANAITEFEKRLNLPPVAGGNLQAMLAHYR